MLDKFFKLLRSHGSHIAEERGSERGRRGLAAGAESNTSDGSADHKADTLPQNLLCSRARLTVMSGGIEETLELQRYKRSGGCTML
jgi:hypothetical protein